MCDESSEWRIDLCNKVIRSPEIHFVIKFRENELRIKIHCGDLQVPHDVIINDSLLNIPGTIVDISAYIGVLERSIVIESKGTIAKADFRRATANTEPVDISNLPGTDNSVFEWFKKIFAAGR